MIPPEYKEEYYKRTGYFTSSLILNTVKRLIEKGVSPKDAADWHKAHIEYHEIEEKVKEFNAFCWPDIKRINEIKERPGSEISPAFGTGCSSSLENIPRSKAVTARRKELAIRHGTPTEFAETCYKAVPGFISIKEADKAIQKYEEEWNCV